MNYKSIEWLQYGSIRLGRGQDLSPAPAGSAPGTCVGIVGLFVVGYIAANAGFLLDTIEHQSL